MSKKTILSIGLIAFGVCGALLVIFSYSLSGGNAIVTLACLAAAIACIVAGTILQFSQLLDRYVTPVLDEIEDDIEDDLQDLREKRITNTIWMIILTGIAALAFTFIIFRLHKLEALWGPIPVVIPTAIGMAVLALYITHTRWYQNFRDYTPMWVFCIPTLGLILTMILGLANTENTSLIVQSRAVSTDYNSFEMTGFFLQGAGDTGDIFNLFGDIDDDSGVIGLVIFLVILVFVLLVGSAVIPHFWLFSGAILLGMMALIAIHDLRIRRERSKHVPAQRPKYLSPG